VWTERDDLVACMQRFGGTSARAYRRTQARGATPQRPGVPRAAETPHIPRLNEKWVINIKRSLLSIARVTFLVDLPLTAVPIY